MKITIDEDGFPQDDEGLDLEFDAEEADPESAQMLYEAEVDSQLSTKSGPFDYSKELKPWMPKKDSIHQILAKEIEEELKPYNEFYKDGGLTIKNIATSGDNFSKPKTLKIPVVSGLSEATDEPTISYLTTSDPVVLSFEAESMKYPFEAPSLEDIKKCLQPFDLKILHSIYNYNTLKLILGGPKYPLMDNLKARFLYHLSLKITDTLNIIKNDSQGLADLIHPMTKLPKENLKDNYIYLDLSLSYYITNTASSNPNKLLERLKDYDCTILNMTYGFQNTVSCAFNLQLRMSNPTQSKFYKMMDMITKEMEFDITDYKLTWG